MQQKIEIVIPEFMDQVAVERISNCYETHYDPKLHSEVERLHAILGSALAVIVRNRTQVDSAFINNAPDLKVVGRLGVGLDNIDLECCKNRNIKVIPATGGNSTSVAEYVVSAMLVLNRGVFLNSASVTEGKWPRNASIGREISGNTLGLVGFGDIARQVASRVGALNMSVVAHDPHLEESNPAWQLARKVNLEELLTESDVVSLHVPLTADTHHLIGQQELIAMKNSAILINTARGGVVDETALISALKNGQIGAAALDVFETEPVDREYGRQFKDLPNLILTPHIAGVTWESNARVSEMIADEVLKFLSENQ